MKFFVNCNPPKNTAQTNKKIFRNRKTGKLFIGNDNKGKETRDELFLLLAPYSPSKPFQGALELKVKYIFPWRKNETKKNISKGYRFCDKRPDCDNLNKELCDILSKLKFWNDDGQVAILNFEKMWGNTPGIGIEINNIVDK